MNTMQRKPSTKLTGLLSAFEDTIKKNEETGGNTSCITSRFAKRNAADFQQQIIKNKTVVQERKAIEEANKPKTSERTSWKNSNLALINSDLAHKIRAEASELEPAWNGIGEDIGTHVWRIEQFKVVPWSPDRYGEFHTGDSYIVLHAYRRGMAAALYFDVYIWIGE